MILDTAKRVLELASKATAGPWHHGPYYKSDVHSAASGVSCIFRGSSVLPMDCRDAAFIAAMRTDAPALAKAVIALTAERERLIDLLRPMAEYAVARDSYMDNETMSPRLIDGHSVVEFGSVARGMKSYAITIGHCRAAARAVEAFGEEQE